MENSSDERAPSTLIHKFKLNTTINLHLVLQWKPFSEILCSTL